MPEGPVFDGACSSSQATKPSVASRAAAIACLSARPLPAVFSGELVERRDLAAHRACAGDPEVVRVAGEISPRLREEGRDDRELAGELRLGLARERERVRPELDDVVMDRAFMRRRVALLGPDAEIEGGVARPGLEHAGVEIEAVHLRADERLVDALLDRPVARCRSPRGASR